MQILAYKSKQELLSFTANYCRIWFYIMSETDVPSFSCSEYLKFPLTHSRGIPYSEKIWRRLNLAQLDFFLILRGFNLAQREEY